MPTTTPKVLQHSLLTTSTRNGCNLIPQENPNIDPTQTSLSGVSYQKVLDGLNQLYPPESLEERNAASRADGYWRFIQKGQDPPKEFTYGEFDVIFLAQLLDRVCSYYHHHLLNDDKDSRHGSSRMTWDDKVFSDIGSGTGRLVFGAAALHPNWKLCRGIEILEGISNIAQSKEDECRERQNYYKDTIDEEDEEEVWVENENGLLVKADPKKKEPDNPPEQEQDDDTVVYSLPVGDNNDDEDKTNHQQRLALAPIEFVCGSFEDPYLYFGDVDCVFCFSSCMSTSILQSLSRAIGRQCRIGTIVITTDFSLELKGYIPPFPDDPSLPHGHYELELLESLDGYVWLTGGTSTAYIHRVKKSLWNGSGPRTKPILPASEKAFRAIKAAEAEKDDAAIRFLAGVRNNMLFAGFPEKWLPDPSRYRASKEEGDA